MRTPYEIRLQGGRVLKTTPVFDTYWRFASERQEMFMRRVQGSTPPWTEDPILSVHRYARTRGWSNTRHGVPRGGSTKSPQCRIRQRF